MLTKKIEKVLLTVVALGAMTTVTNVAEAGWTVGVDGSYIGAVAVDHEGARFEAESGFEVGPRLGYEIDLALLYLRPEIGVEWGIFDAHTDTRVWGGARAGLATLISPAVYLQAGHGWYRPGGAVDVTGFTMSFGAALDLRVPLVTVGLHIEYDVTPAYSTNWVNPGAHVELRF